MRGRERDVGRKEKEDEMTVRVNPFAVDDDDLESEIDRSVTTHPPLHIDLVLVVCLIELWVLVLQPCPRKHVDLALVHDRVQLVDLVVEASDTDLAPSLVNEVKVEELALALKPRPLPDLALERTAALDCPSAREGVEGADGDDTGGGVGTDDCT